MASYYNEFDPFAAAWLQKLMDKKLIPKGDIDTRSITEVKPNDIRNYTQCHFFAGIAGWSESLRLAGWETDRNVWTGSCPCQPFSTAGKQKGRSDGRHLWPVWFNLIRECQPSVVFGEQVSSAIAHGWLDEVANDLEAEGYAFGSAIIPACGVGAPHKRDRLWFVADSQRNKAHQEQPRPAENERRWCTDLSSRCHMDCKQSPVGNSISKGFSGYWRFEQKQISKGWERKEGYNWSSGIWIDCPDGKQRLIEPSIRLLAHGVPNRVAKLRGYGNAIVPQVAAKFIEAYMSI